MVHLILLLWMFELFSFSTAQDCRYTYVRQPLTQSQCNPYVREQINLLCIVNGPIDEVFDILWFRQTQTSDGPEELRRGGRVAISPVTLGSQLPGNIEHGSTMQLSSLNEEDIGQYWCQIKKVKSSTLLEQSNLLNLTNEQSYNRLRPCELNTEDFITEQTTCADLPSPIPPTGTMNETNQTPTTATTVTINEPNQIQTTATEPGRTSSQSTAEITAATTEGDPESPSGNQAIGYSVLAVIVVTVAFIITIAVIIVIVVFYKRRHGHMTTRKKWRENEPTAGATEYVNIATLPTWKCGTELENRTYDVPVVKHSGIGAPFSTDHEYEGTKVKYDYADSHLPVNKQKNCKPYASGHGPVNSAKENKSYARVHKGAKGNKENKSYARVHKGAKENKENKSYARVHKGAKENKENKSYARLHKGAKENKENKSYARVHRSNFK